MFFMFLLIIISYARSLSAFSTVLKHNNIVPYISNFKFYN